MNYSEGKDLWEFSINGVDLYTSLNYLIIFSFVGWVWESCYVSVRQHKLVNRGYVTGPFCTIYGFGALSLYIILRPVSGNYLLLFLCGSFVATVLEYYTAAVMEYLFHTSWWDYSYQKYNYKGRICLSSSIAWGVCAILLFAFFSPLADRFISLYSVKTGKRMMAVIGILYAIDYTFATIAAVDVSKQIVKLESMLDDISDLLKSSKVYSTGEELVDRLGAFKRQIMEIDYYKRYSKRLEVREAVWQERFSKISSNAMNSELVEALRKITDRFEDSVKGLKFLQNRILSAYPHMKSRDLMNRFRNKK